MEILPSQPDLHGFSLSDLKSLREVELRLPLLRLALARALLPQSDLDSGVIERLGALLHLSLFEVADGEHFAMQDAAALPSSLPMGDTPAAESKGNRKRRGSIHEGLLAAGTMVGDTGGDTTFEVTVSAPETMFLRDGGFLKNEACATRSKLTGRARRLPGRRSRST